ncbi:MAG: hypothetical protein GF313_10175, partial [Caldithrix sp.]|nr:hypothetical protein [Caldithrix sp.]
MLTLPIFLFYYEPAVSTKLVGIIDLSGENLEKELQRELNKSYRLENNSPEYIVLDVSVDNSEPYKNMLDKFNEIKDRKDSITTQYQQIKEQRTEYYKNPNIPNRDVFLQESYKNLQETREEKELVEIEMARFKSALDSLYKDEAVEMADSLLMTKVLNAYLIFPSDFTQSGTIHYHSRTPGDLKETERLSKVLQTIVIKKRMSDDDISRRKMQQWLRPVNIKKYQLLPEGQQEWNFYVQFYGPLIGVFLLFMAIFTAGGYLFSGVLQEKTNRVIEVLLSYANSRQIMGGKILGMGFLGLAQVLIWFGLTAVLIAADIIPIHKISYINLTNALYFILYFSLGFLFFGSIFISVASLAPNEYDAQQVNQLLRTIAIFPVLLSLIVLAEPNSTLIRVLSYVPFLTPSFMIMRIPLSGEPLVFDIYI